MGAVGLDNYQMELTPAEIQFYKQMKKLNELALFAPNNFLSIEKTKASMMGAALGK